ncbi:MAG TPA: oxygen-independent coproporphyrinogen III oxidase [Flavobacteriales bacterium]|nr:oxygen-independent coproporphyrinogen III oxidase [Flavobacteriales bacterium]
MSLSKEELIRKYNIPGPRYTSYPTVPFWDEKGIDKKDWITGVQKAFDESNSIEGISLYIHLPFCENLCTFCGCHKRITKKHSVEEPYIDTLLKEWKLYLDILPFKPRIKEIHLGGGTPTFFSSDNLKKLINGILADADVTDNYEFSFEGHPNNTTKEHLQTLYDLGFRRNSFGVQDYDPLVQKTINRIQPFENVKRVTELSREIGYTSISHDLVFGLPKQTLESVVNTINKTRELMPDRIAYYSYAHVPWIKGVGQRGFDESDLPKDEQKRELYEIGKKMFAEIGYVEIGMDHFALKHDSLYKAMKNKTLHRNFMGYTSGTTKLMIGLGMSSISDSWYAFAQNNKSTEEYQAIVNNGEIPIFRGHLLNNEDLIIRRHILNIMCHFETSWEDESLQFEELPEVTKRLKEMENDGLVVFTKNGLMVPEKARPFVRNICMAFDLRLLRNKPKTRIFSMTI